MYPDWNGIWLGFNLRLAMFWPRICRAARIFFSARGCFLVATAFLARKMRQRIFVVAQESSTHFLSRPTHLL